MFIVRITVLVFRVEISDTVTLVLALVHAIHISPFSRCHYLANYYHMSLEIVLPKEVSKGDWKFFVSYSFQSPVGIILLTDEF